MLIKGLPALTLAALLIGATPVQAQQTSRPPERPATQQQPSQQALRLQQQMTQMQQHMQQLRERIQVVDQDLVRSMDRVQARDQDRVREHQALREMCTDLGAMTRQMEQSANRLQENVQNRLFQEDAQLRREADRLRERYRDMAHEMELSVQALERMQKRLGQVVEDDS